MLPGLWVDHEAPVDSPWRSNDGVIKFIEFPVRKPQMSRRAFRLYWQRHHSPHVMNVTMFSQFMRKYVTGHVYEYGAPMLPSCLQDVPHFEGVGEVWLNSLEDAKAWLGQPIYAELIAPDEEKFLDRTGAGEAVIVREERVLDTDRDLAESGMTKLWIMAQGAPGLSHDEFHESVSRYGRSLAAEAISRSLLRRLVVSHRLRDPYPDWMPPSPIDAVLEFWVDDRNALDQFLRGAHGRGNLCASEPGIFDVGSLRVVVTSQHAVHDEFSFQPTIMQPSLYRRDC